MRQLLQFITSAGQQETKTKENEPEPPGITCRQVFCADYSRKRTKTKQK